jgi:hypothetical protein
MRAYILEHTRDIFIGQPDEPCSRAAHLEPTNSGADPLRSTASMAATHSLERSEADPPASATVGVGPWPPPATRDT